MNAHYGFTVLNAFLWRLCSQLLKKCYFILGSVEFINDKESYGTVDNSAGQMSVQSFTYLTWFKNLGNMGWLFAFRPASCSSHGFNIMYDVTYVFIIFITVTATVTLTVGCEFIM